MWGGKLSNAKNTKIKYVVALDGDVTIFHTQQPNQKHVGAMKRVYKSRWDQGGACRGGGIIVLGGIRSWKEVKN
jgi:hypothetical protein